MTCKQNTKIVHNSGAGLFVLVLNTVIIGLYLQFVTRYDMTALKYCMERVNKNRYNSRYITSTDTRIL